MRGNTDGATQLLDSLQDSVAGRPACKRNFNPVCGVHGQEKLAAASTILLTLPQLDFTPIAGKRRTKYFAAIQAGFDRNYRPMAEIFTSLIERSLAVS